MSREQEIFNAAFERTTVADRAAFLDVACDGRADMRLRMEALLRAADAAGGFLAEDEAEMRHHTGASIGRYRLGERIGEGGFGLVYRAEQDEPVRRTVALKIIKLGMDTRAVVARFEAERQALAMMDHPNIARVLDGGATSAGRPYFVMELVRGQPITQFCNERKLGLRARLELFRQVCRAVHHAHQKGIIHRDLKPSNILITLDDDRPLAKVIDFGIAKATQEPLTAKTLVTRLNVFMGTPAYMSPEQVGLGHIDIDTRSDIYSLGALLYELLTDCTLFDSQKLLAAGYAEVQRTIHHVEPIAPSQRVAGLDAETRARIAARRETTPGRLVADLHGDLDRIVLKCLEKDRTRRYETTNALGRDITSFLNHEPVMARPATLHYRATKFVRRHTRGVTAAAAGLVLVGGFVAFHAQRLATERDRARIEALKAAKVSELLTEVLTVSDPYRNSGGAEPTLGAILDAAYARVQQPQFANEPEVRLQVLNAIGRIHLRLGHHDKAAPVLAAALAAGREIGRPDARLAQTLSDLGILQRERGDYPAAMRSLQDALALRRQLFGENHADVGVSVSELGRLFLSMERYDRAEGLFRESLAIRRQVHGEIHRETATILGDLGMLLWQVGRLAEAEPLLEQSVAIHRATVGAQHANYAMSMANLAKIRTDLGDYPTAEQLLREAVPVVHRTLGEKSWRAARVDCQLGSLLRKTGRLDEAAATIGTALENSRRALGPDHMAVASIGIELARVYLDRHEGAAAEPLLRHAVRVFTQTSPVGSWRVAQTKGLLGLALAEMDRNEEAEALLAEASRDLRDVPGPQGRDTKTIRARLSALYAANAEPEKAALSR